MANKATTSLPGKNGLFRTFLKSHETCTQRPHYHPSYEMNFVLKGEGTRYVGNHRDYFEEGDLILLAPDIPHNWMSKQQKAEEYSSLVMQWDENFMGSDWQHSPEFSHISRLLAQSVKGIVFDKSMGKEIERYKDRLLNLPPFEKIILLLQILNDFSKSDEYKFLSEDGFQTRQNTRNSRIKTVMEFIDEHYSEKITLKMVASLVNMSEGAFSRYFSQTYKKPFFSYLNEYRINQSYRLLEETDLRINEIGYACGYDCLQFFYRQFMKYTNCAPLDYRKKFSIQ